MDEFEAKYKTSKYYLDAPEFTRLHFAAIMNYPDIAETLISQGNDVNAKDIIYHNINIIY